MLTRKVPSTFASQHPDHASVPYWKEDGDPMIKAGDEALEVFLAFSELGIQEYKWDWEGKLVDESVIERLLIKYYDFFKTHPLGKERFLTYRLPNPNVETEQRVGRAFMGLLSASGLTQSLKLPTPPMNEVILPMCETAHSMIDIQEAFREIANLKHWLFGFQSSNLRHIQVIPLFEQTQVIANSESILTEYVKLHEDRFGFRPNYLRPYVARSDPSLNSGHIATLLAIKIAFSKYKEFEDNFGIELYPMIGCAALLFRGGLKPDRIEDFVNEYAGVKTVLIQSGFRYDYPKEVAIQGINKLNQLLPKTQPRIYTQKDYKNMFELMELFENAYRDTIENLAYTVNQIARVFPSRRERVQHTGLFGYSRGVGKVTLPRAIKFTGSLYSIGLPPSLIGAGRGLRLAEEKNLINDLSDYYLNIKNDYQVIARFVNKENLRLLAEEKIKIDTKTSTETWSEILQDIDYLEQYLQLDFRPQSQEEVKHQKLTTNIAIKLNAKNFEILEIQELITKAGKLRKSLG